MKRGLLVLLLFLLASLSHADQSPFDLKQLKAPDGFHIAVFANVDGPRLLTFTPGGILLVSESGEGKVVALPDPKQTGKAERVVEVLTGLNEPHGIAFFSIDRAASRRPLQDGGFTKTSATSQSSDPCSAEMASQNSLSNTRELGVRQSTDTRKEPVLGTRASLSSHPPRRTKAWHHEADWVAHFPQDLLHIAPGDRG